MRKDEFLIISNEEIAKYIYKMVLKGNTKGYDKPGVFATLTVKECYLNRPISISMVEKDHITLVYKVVGKGTDLMSKMKKNESITLLGPLGNGYELIKDIESPLIIGGGIGIPPLLNLARKLKEMGLTPKVILGFNDISEVFYINEFKKITEDVNVFTLNGTYEKQGMVTDGFEHGDYIYACGPMPMLRALSNKCDGGQFSLEARMGCGFGACMGCSIETTKGTKRVCKEGPVFSKEEIIWED